jgi:6-phosphogluconolactonase (cycloisomerase 2 family)
MTALYDSVGEVLTRYEVDVEGATLTRKGSVTLPDNVQYVWPHPTRRYLYVVSSNRGPDAPAGRHFLNAFRMDPATGALQPHGATLGLASRPVHMSLDRTGSYALVAYTIPAALTVHRIDDDCTLGAQVDPAGPLDTGIFAHQVLATPSNRAVILVTRGNDAAGGKPEDPGALKVFDFRDGMLANKASIAPGRGYGFGPRHLDFHPTRPWVYVSIERQNQLQLYRMQDEGLAGEPAFVKNTLVEPDNRRPRQLGGAIHVHPNGRFVYMSNRADHTVEFAGKKVFGGGENSIAVFAIDEATGEPTLIQHADPKSYHVRTFTLDPAGKILVAASIAPMQVREGAGVTTVPAALSVFRIGADGKLDFVRKYDIETAGKTQWWAGIV